MPEQNPNYVPVDWASSPHPDDPRSELGNDGLTDEERDGGIAPMFGPPVVIDTGAERRRTEALLNAATPVFDVDHRGDNAAEHPESWPDPEDTDPARETSTLNSAGEPIKIGDRVHHVADASSEKRDVGVVRYIGPVTIIGTIVENGVGVQWDGAKKQESHHADSLTVLL